MGAKGKYRSEIIEAILSAIRKTGQDKDGYEAGGIAMKTFYEWMKGQGAAKGKKPQFAQLVEKAKREFRRTCPENLREKALLRVADYLNNETVEVWDSIDVFKDANGNVTGTKQSQRKVQRPCPPAIIDRVLGKNLPLLDAIQTLMGQGICPPEVMAIVESNLNNMYAELRSLYGGDGMKNRQLLEGVLKDAGLMNASTGEPNG